MQVRLATQPQEREAIYALREAVYVAELGNPQDSRDFLAGHDHADETAFHFFAEEGGRVVGTVRANLSADAAFRGDYAAHYGLSRFRPLAGDDRMAMISRFAVEPSYRGSMVALELILACARLLRDRGVEIIFGDCALNLLTLYRSLGFRPYCEPYHQDNAGTLVPFAFVTGDVGYLRRLHSPLARLAPDDAPDTTETARKLVAALAPVGAPLAAVANSEAFWGAVSEALGSPPGMQGVLAGLSEADVRRLLSRSHVVSLTRPQKLVKRGHVAWERWVLLEGHVQVVGRPVAVGDLIGDGVDLESDRHGIEATVGEGGARLLSVDVAKLSSLLQGRGPLRARLLANLPSFAQVGA
jgi:predicted GNAT family N-acyltransferase